MANDAKKTSQLGIATTLSANDRVVVLTNPAASAQTQTVTVNNFINSLRYANASVSGVVKVGTGLSINATGFLNGGANGLPSSGQEFGYVVAWSNTVNSAIWSPFSTPYQFSLVYESNTYTTTAEDYIVFVDPGTFGNSISIRLPNNAVIGKSYQIKNINPSDGYDVTVRIVGNTSVLENPSTGEFQNSFVISEKGESQEWIWDGTYYRHLGSQTNLPGFSASANSFTEISLQNRSSGTNASGDVVVYSDAGNTSTGAGPYIDMGINSSTYNNPLYSVNGPNDGYIYTNGGDLSIGTANVGTSLIFHAGNTIANNTKLSINSTAIAVNTATAFILPIATKANNSPGVAGQISWDTNNIYVCVATNNWKKVSINDFS